MAWTGALADLGYDDDEMLDRTPLMPGQAEPPDYPLGCMFSLAESDLIEAAGEGGEIGDEMRFAAMAEVTSCHQGTSGDRVELQIEMFAGDDGEFFKLSEPGWLSLTDRELGKMGLDADCDVGDLIHLIGEARLDSLHRSEFGETASLQILRLSYAEDENDEGREG